MIATKYKAFFEKRLEGVARQLIRWGLTPNQLTLAGLGLGMLSCAYLVLTRNLVVFCILITVFGCLDGVDGLVARLTQRVSKFGSYLDALCDRYFEALVVISVAYVTGYWLLSLVVMFGVLVVSYAKARAAIEVPVSNTEWPDFMERAERDVVFIAGLFLSQLIRKEFWGHDLFFWTLVFLSIATHLTALQRILRAKRIITARQEANSG